MTTTTKRPATGVKPIPDGFHGATPYLACRGAAQAIEFYKQAFGAVERERIDMPGSGLIGHAELRIGEANIMLADEFPKMGFVGPQTLGGSGVTIHLYVTDVDAVVNKAVAAGAKVVKPVEDQFYGDRTGKIEDPFGHIWYLATHIEDVPPDEIRRRADKLFGGKT
jgi:PhnB protein